MMMQIIRRARTKIEETTEEGLTRTVQRAGAELTRLGCFGNRTNTTTETEICSRDSFTNNCGTSVRRARGRKKKRRERTEGPNMGLEVDVVSNSLLMVLLLLMYAFSL
jgi:hypothetical protein